MLQTRQVEKGYDLEKALLQLGLRNSDKRSSVALSVRDGFQTAGDRGGSADRFLVPAADDTVPPTAGARKSDRLARAILTASESLHQKSNISDLSHAEVCL